MRIQAYFQRAIDGVIVPDEQGEPLNATSVSEELFEFRWSAWTFHSGQSSKIFGPVHPIARTSIVTAAARIGFKIEPLPAYTPDQIGAIDAETFETQGCASTPPTRELRRRHVLRGVSMVRQSRPRAPGRPPIPRGVCRGPTCRCSQAR